MGRKLKVGDVWHDKRTGQLGEVTKIENDKMTISGKINMGIVCQCDCHRDGKDIMHCWPCCDFCYEKFILKDGTIEYKRLYNILYRIKYGNPKRTRIK